MPQPFRALGSKVLETSLVFLDIHGPFENFCYTVIWLSRWHLSYLYILVFKFYSRKAIAATT